LLLPVIYSALFWRVEWFYPKRSIIIKGEIMVNVKELTSLDLKRVREIAEFLEIPNFEKRSKNIIISAISKLPNEMDVTLKEFMGIEVVEEKPSDEPKEEKEIPKEVKTEKPKEDGYNCREVCANIEKIANTFDESDEKSFLSFIAFIDSKLDYWYSVRKDINRKNAKPTKQISLVELRKINSRIMKNLNR
jgi:hypothetical protein